MMKGDEVAGSMMEAVDHRLLEVQHTVRSHFGWSYEADRQSAASLRASMSSSAPHGVEVWSPLGRRSTYERLVAELMTASKVIVVGAAARPTDVQRAWSNGCVVVAADGAVGACRDVVDTLCVVTDLDGGEHLQRAAQTGTTLVVHAHGDNIDRWSACLGSWASQPSPPPLILSHQTDEMWDDMLNPGGFTDGDRAVCFLLGAGVATERICCVGFSSDHVGPWSGVTSPERKLEKLKWMKKILDWVLPKQ